MKRKNLLFLLFLAFFAPWAANAQETLTVCNGTEINEYVPFYGYYADANQHNQMIYPASQLGGMNGGTISQLVFYFSSNYGSNSDAVENNCRLGTWTVSLGETQATTLSGLDNTTSLTQVYEGCMTWSHANLTLTITFDTPYTYNGGNLLLDFNHEAANYNRYYFYGVTAPEASYCYGSQRNFLPKTTFTYEEAASDCPKPTNFVASNVTAHTADLSWESDGLEFVLEYKKASDSNWNEAWLEEGEHSITLDNLSGETEYQARVAAFHETCPTDPETGDHVFSDWRTISFTTLVSCPEPTGLEVTANGQNATFTWTSDASEWDVYYSTEQGTPDEEATLITVNSVPFTVNGLDLDTDYYFWVRANCGSEGYSAWAGPVSVHIGYCVPNPSSHDGNGITGVSFGTGDYVVTNGDGSASLPASAPYYGNYSSMIGAVQAGVESTIAITTGTNSYPYTFVIWVDFDNSLSFEDSEVVYIGKASSGNGTLNATITIPATQELGDYRMRIYGADSYFTSFYNNGNPDYTKPHDPCSSGSYRHAHDYTLRVLEAPSCLTPTGLTASDVTAHEATISWTSDASAWEIQLDEEEAIEVTEATYTFTGLTAETEYSVKVRTNCSGTYSDWTNAITFTTGIACPAPTELAAALTQGNGSIATLSWTSSASAWVVAYKTADDEEFTEVNVTENPYTLTGLTPETAYTAKVKAVCGGIDGESQWSSTVTFTPSNAYTITVNDGTATNSFVPVYGTWVDSYTKCQFIIPASELVDMQYGNINKMTFYSSTANKTWGAAEFDILLTEVNNTTFESATLVDWADMDQVYHGAVSISDYKMEIVFDNDYQYMGGNLLVGFHQTVKGTYSGISWYGVSSTNSAIGGYESSAKALSLQSFLPKTTFDFEPGEEPSCIKPTNLAVEYTGGTEAIVSWNSEATAWNMRVNGVEVNGVITNPYTLTGLELATTYAVEVQANCGDNGVSDWAGPVSFTTDLCLPENMCEIGIELTDAYGDGGGQIQVVDALTDEVLGTYTNSGASTSYTLAVCDGRELNFVYTNTDNYAYENGFVFTDVNGEVIAEHVGCSSSGCTPPTNGVVATYTVSCTVSSCKKPTDLAVSEIGPRSAVLSWTENGEATEWEVEITNIDNDEAIQWTAVSNPYTMLYLDPETNYSVRVLPHCEVDKWSDPITFTTNVPCPAPTVTFSNVTVHTANVSCNGYAANYEMEYAIAGISGSVTYDFEDGTLQGWTNLIVNAEGGQWLHSNDNGGAYDYTGLAHSGTSFAMCYSFIDGVGSFETDAYLVSPNRYQISESASLNFWYDMANDTYPEYTEVCIATAANPTASDFTAIWNTNSAKGSNGLRAASANRQSNTRYQNWREVTLDLSDYAGQSIWIAFHDENYDAYEIWIDDVTVNLGGELTWTPVGTVTSPYTLSDLDPETAYMVRARANCGEDGESGWSSIATFTTFDLIVWNVDEDWPNDSVPEEYADVTIPANTDVIIPSGYTAYADEITLGENSQIIMEPGAQFYHSNEIPVTVQMNVIGYDSGSKDGVGGFYLIASPINPSISAPAAGLIPESNEDPAYAGIDLYQFDQVGDGQGNEWLNYKVDNFDLNLMQGYLYASDATITAMFAGQTMPTNADLSKELEYVDSADLPGVNLVGNPFTCSAYINGGQAFYTMNKNGDEIVTAVSNTIDPLQGIFVEAEQAGDSVTFTTTPPETKGSLALNLSQGRGTIDRAIVRFGESSQLRKFQLNPNHTKVYIPMNGKDYAVVTAEEMGEMPVNFKAEKNGTYTLSFTAEEVNFNYLHLIDNMTGADVDLLATPSYTFEAQTTDYATRFRLVFATGNNSTEDFAFFSNGNLVINNEGNATLQVVDVMGRILSSETINGSTSINFNGAAGVYMIRLINGENAKVQKVVIR